MPTPIEFFLDVGSPTTYLAWTQMPGLAKRTGSQIIYRPMLLGGVFKATGNASPVTIPAKGANLMRDIERYAEHYGVTYRANPYFPLNTLNLMRGAASCKPGVELERYLGVIFSAIWEQERNLGDPMILREVLGNAGIDADDIFARIQTAEVKQALVDTTEEAIRRGVFGAPTFFVGDEMFFGQDRLAMVEKYAKRG
jgi:2-hydroxychromene-2-carboxylate isomerase